MVRTGWRRRGSRMRGCPRPACGRHTRVRARRPLGSAGGQPARPLRACHPSPRCPPPHHARMLLPHHTRTAMHPTQPPSPALPADMVVMVRTLYQKCRLVHADLSGEGAASWIPCLPSQLPAKCTCMPGLHLLPPSPPGPAHSHSPSRSSCACPALPCPALCCPALLPCCRVQCAGAQERAVLHRCQPGSGAGSPARL